MGMNRIDKGMNRGRTVGGNLQGAARRHRIERNRGEETVGHSFTSGPNFSSLFSHYRPILHSSSLGGDGGASGGRDGPAVSGAMRPLNSQRGPISSFFARPLKCLGLCVGHPSPIPVTHLDNRYSGRIWMMLPLTLLP